MFIYFNLLWHQILWDFPQLEIYEMFMTEGNIKNK